MKNYRLTIEHGDESCTLETDSLVDLTVMLNKVVADGMTCKGSGLEATARDVLGKYKSKYESNRQSKIELVGAELEVVKCYIQGLAIGDTVSHLNDNFGVKVSKSSIGRMWARMPNINEAQEARRQRGCKLSDS